MLENFILNIYSPFLMYEQVEAPPEKTILTVSELNGLVRDLLEDNFPFIWVSGEISNFSRPSSGHWYFSLKDSRAQVRCAMFRMRNQYLKFIPEAGNQVLVQARVSLYPDRGDYQLIVEHIQEAGDGILQRAYEQLKQRLSQEGLFDEKYKKPLPTFPHCIGVVTSPTGAAIRDILSVLERRFPCVPIIIYPTVVQGSQAAPHIIRALKLANERKECEVLIIARGGGSLEDLWPFNEEAVARAIFNSVIPVVSGVGHEVDFTITDFVADQRAATPSAAAELVSPNQLEYQQLIIGLVKRLVASINQHHMLYQHNLINLQKRLRHPGQRLQDQAQHLDHLEQRLYRSKLHYLQTVTIKLQKLMFSLYSQSPQYTIKNFDEQFKAIEQQLIFSCQYLITDYKKRLGELIRALEAISPLATLNRGYAIVTRNNDSAIVRSTTNLENGDNITVRLAKGLVNCTVNKIIE